LLLSSQQGSFLKPASGKLQPRPLAPPFLRDFNQLDGAGFRAETSGYKTTGMAIDAHVEATVPS